MLEALLEKGNGYIRTADVLESGISKPMLAKYAAALGLERVAHGVYMSGDAWPDDYYLLAVRNRRIVFSYESALYLHGLMDREPRVATVTVPRSYNAAHIVAQGVRVVHIRPEWYGIGLSKTLTSAGNEVPVYDRERTICDIIRGKKDMEVQTFQTAMREYMGGPGKDLGRLIGYARTFGIEREVRTYTEVML